MSSDNIFARAGSHALAVAVIAPLLVLAADLARDESVAKPTGILAAVASPVVAVLRQEKNELVVKAAPAPSPPAVPVGSVAPVVAVVPAIPALPTIPTIPAVPAVSIKQRAPAAQVVTKTPPIGHAAMQAVPVRVAPVQPALPVTPSKTALVQPTPPVRRETGFRGGARRTSVALKRVRPRRAKGGSPRFKRSSRRIAGRRAVRRCGYYGCRGPRMATARPAIRHRPLAGRTAIVFLVPRMRLRP
ncbi:MAG TPA: hypothetical protein VMX97_03775 [Hyphomicrobiaceae bacterium]|nr:hypothetical protein [Hyphomicrobiaceae bacterium]